MDVKREGQGAEGKGGKEREAENEGRKEKRGKEEEEN